MGRKQEKLKKEQQLKVGLVGGWERAGEGELSGMGKRK